MENATGNDNDKAVITFYKYMTGANYLQLFTAKPDDHKDLYRIFIWLEIK